jgi:two-component system, sensor histidine kinase and response regulator
MKAPTPKAETTAGGTNNPKHDSRPPDSASSQAEEVIAHDGDLLQVLLNNSPDRIYFKDKSSRFLRISRAMAEFFKLENPDQAVGKWDFDFFTDEHASQAYADEQRILQNGQPLIGLVEKETLPGGGFRWVTTTKMPLHDRKGKVVGTFGISRDITDLKLAEEALHHAKDAAEGASRTKSQFLANMSHELRTPLNSVIGFANILRKNKESSLTPAQINFLERILANGKHLLVLINEILDLSKIEAQRIELQLVNVSLDTLVRETLAEQEPLVRGKAVRLRAELPARLEVIETDAEKLRQVLVNLIGNALKFTAKGSVVVRVVADPVSHRPLRLEVSDTGIGIPQDKLGSIFDAFQQGDAGTNRRFGGTGLGLTISQALCRIMGYRLEVASEVERGSTFSIVLSNGHKMAGSAIGAPRASKPASVDVGLPAIQTASKPTSLDGKLVLVVDDEMDSRTLLTNVVEEFGCRVVGASSGEQGLGLARELHPHIITVDLLMPRMDGWQFVGAIKADPELCHIPVVVVSIVAGEDRGRVLGAVDVLQKPVAQEELMAALQRNLQSARARVLVVDDDEDSRRILCSHLKEIGAEIREAANGVEALAQLASAPCDLVLLDLIMPQMDGMTLLNVLRCDPRYQRLPAVVVTARQLNAEELAALRRQSQEVLSKADVFAGKLKTLLNEIVVQARSEPMAEALPAPVLNVVNGSGPEHKAI